MTFSDDAQDKLQACLNQTWAESDYLSEKIYYDACTAWWDDMLPEHQAIGVAVLDAYDIDHPEAAARIAANLPAAPKCPI
ncbi:MAG TPA: hypothetical protein VMT98_06780 [Verrucomicrobiae bacterium]|nr:hypothetical protein [Verrucomicrobiae bacterium]